MSKWRRLAKDQKLEAWCDVVNRILKKFFS